MSEYGKVTFRDVIPMGFLVCYLSTFARSFITEIKSVAVCSNSNNGLNGLLAIFNVTEIMSEKCQRRSFFKKRPSVGIIGVVNFISYPWTARPQ